MVIDFNKVPPKKLFLVGILTFIPVLAALLLYSLNYTGNPQGIPHEFAVDNEERVYLSLDSGIYVAEDDRLTLLLPPTRYGYALSVSEDDMLTIADASVIRIVDLAKSDLASGHLEVIKRTHALYSALYSIWRENWETDSQNGVTYRLRHITYYYEILREDKDGSAVILRKPYSYGIWDSLARNSILFLSLYLGAEIILISIYVKKHPEIQKQASDTSGMRKQQ